MTWPQSASPLGNQWTAGERVTAVKMNARVDAQLNALQTFIQTLPIQTLSFAPSGNIDTAGAGTATWITLGSVTVPVWSTSAWVIFTVDGAFDTGTTANVSNVIKIGTATGGVSRRIPSPGVTGRFSYSIVDRISSMSTGSQSVTISSTFTSGTVVRADTSSTITALIIFSA